MKSRLLLLTLCALASTACDDGAAPGENRDPPVSNRDTGVLAPEPDAAPPVADMTSADMGTPVLDAETGVDRGVDPEPEPGPDPEPDGPCESGETRVCPDACGVQVCVGGAFGACQSSAERCNGHDDNCDGRVDEGFAGLGIGCIVDMDGCSAQGTRICAPDGGSVICDAPPAVPSPEACDGDDDDCDGRVDEDFPGRTCCADDLQCGPGEQCVGGECSGGVGPGPGPGPGGCVDDFDCDLFEVCAQGQCVPFCLSDFDCFGTDECVGGACVPAAPECLADGDCLPNEVCEAQSCMPAPPPPCADDAECPGLLACEAGQCVRPAGVTSCDAAIQMPAFGEYIGDNRTAFDDFGASCGLANNGPEQFFVFSVEVPTRVTLDTAGSDFDTILAVLEGCAAGARAVGCNDDFGAGATSRVVFDALPGVQYAAGVHGYDDADLGGIVMRYSGVEICLADADCAAGEACRAGECRAAPCASAIEMPAFGVYNGSNQGALDEQDARCGSANESGEQVFTFALAEPAEVVLDTVGSPFDTVMSVRTECGVAASEVACNDDAAGQTSALSFVAAAGVRYYVVVEGYGANESGAITLNFDGEVFVPPPPCDEACEGICVSGMCSPPIPPLCEGITTIGEVPNGYGGNTRTGANRMQPWCGQAGNAPELALLVMFPVDTEVYASTFGSVFDTVLYVVEGCDPAARVACNDDAFAFEITSELIFEAEAGVPYYIVVDGYGAASGDFELVVETN